MEKYSQFRDRGSGIAPFLPVSSERSGLYIIFRVFLFFFKLPFFASIFITYFLVLQWFPLGSFLKKAILWMILGIPGVWWIDLQIDGVKKGSLAKKHEGRVPTPSDIIASSFTSPLDSLYLAAIFDPIFTASYPHTRQVECISLFTAIFRALSQPKEYPSKDAVLTDIKTLVARNPQRIIVVFPECTTTNGKGILPFSPSLLTTSADTRIFPISLRYSPADITTPVPGEYFTFLWNLLSQPTHLIRVRIAEAVHNVAGEIAAAEDKERYLTNVLDDLMHEQSTASGADVPLIVNKKITAEERKTLDRVGEALARLGRVKRVGLTTRDKVDFIEAFSKS